MGEAPHAWPPFGVGVADVQTEPAKGAARSPWDNGASAPRVLRELIASSPRAVATEVGVPTPARQTSLVHLRGRASGRWPRTRFRRVLESAPPQLGADVRARRAADARVRQRPQVAPGAPGPICGRTGAKAWRTADVRVRADGPDGARPRHGHNVAGRSRVGPSTVTGRHDAHHTVRAPLSGDGPHAKLRQRAAPRPVTGLSPSRTGPQVVARSSLEQVAGVVAVPAKAWGVATTVGPTPRCTPPAKAPAVVGPVHPPQQGPPGRAGAPPQLRYPSLTECPRAPARTSSVPPRLRAAPLHKGSHLVRTTPHGARPERQSPCQRGLPRIPSVAARLPMVEAQGAGAARRRASPLRPRAAGWSPPRLRAAHAVAGHPARGRTGVGVARAGRTTRPATRRVPGPGVTSLPVGVLLRLGSPRGGVADRLAWHSAVPFPCGPAAVQVLSRGPCGSVYFLVSTPPVSAVTRVAYRRLRGRALSYLTRVRATYHRAHVKLPLITITPVCGTMASARVRYMHGPALFFSHLLLTTPFMPSTR